MTRVYSRPLTMMLPAPDPRPPITTRAEMVDHIRTVIHRQRDISQADDVWPLPPGGVHKSWSERWLDDLSCED